MKGGASLALCDSLELWNSDREIFYDTLGLTKIWSFLLKESNDKKLRLNLSCKSS